MNVEELIDKLKIFPPATKVLARGYESGWEDIDEVEQQEIVHCPNNPWYEGTYQEPASYLNKDLQQLTAILIS